MLVNTLTKEQCICSTYITKTQLMAYLWIVVLAAVLSLILSDVMLKNSSTVHLEQAEGDIFIKFSFFGVNCSFNQCFISIFL